MAITTTGIWTTDNALSIVVRERIIDYAERSVRIAPLCALDETGGVRALTTRVHRWIDISGSVDDVADGTDINGGTPVTLETTGVALTPAVVGMMAEVTDLLASSTPFAGLDPFVRQMAAAVGEEMDDDLAALFDDLNGATRIGTSDADMSLNTFIDGIVTVQTNQAVGPLAACVHPRQAGDLGLSVGGFLQTAVVDATTNTYRTQAGSGGMAGSTSASLIDRLGVPSANGLVGFVAGIPVYTSPRVIDDGTDYEGAIFARDAITISRKWGLRSEFDRDLPGVSTVFSVNTAYAVGETASSFGACVISQN